MKGLLIFWGEGGSGGEGKEGEGRLGRGVRGEWLGGKGERVQGISPREGKKLFLHLVFFFLFQGRK